MASNTQAQNQSPSLKARVGTLTISGLLYEGNFQEWLLAMLASLKVNGIEVLPQPPGNAIRRRRTYIAAWYGGSEEAYALIRGRVNPELLSRLPNNTTSDPESLLVTLAGYATPLRPRNISPEVIEYIYRSLVVEQASSGPAPKGSSGRTTIKIRDVRPVPTLALVGQPWRDEVLQVWYVSKRFDAAVDAPWESGACARLCELVSLWAKGIGKEHLRYVRHLSFNFTVKKVGCSDPYGFRLYADLDYDLEDGVVFTSNSREMRLTSASLDKVKAYLDKVSAEAKALNKQGEALIMVFAGYPEMFEPRTLEAQ